jgi:hypothetical protein
MHCSLLAADCLKLAIEDYRKKQENITKEGKGIFKAEEPIRDIDKKIDEYTGEAAKDELH